LLGVLEGAETCGTLRGWIFYATLISTHERLKSEGASGKGLVFFEGGFGLGRPVFVGLET
jgi:hypothetical protein